MHSARPCRRVACPRTTKHKSGRCELHRSDDGRKTRTERGYDNKWDRFAKAYRARHPFCMIRTHCNGTYSGEVDHIVPLIIAPDRKYDETNLQAACKPCHSAKTQRENQ